MASIPGILTAFETILRANWDEVTYPIAWDNLKFNMPAGAWIRPVNLPGVTENQGLTNIAVRHHGIYWVQVFVPLNSATALGYTLAKQISDLLSNKTFDEVVCYTSDIKRVGDDGKGWFQIDVRTTYFSSERA